jgi:hypothetical protein
LLLQLSIWKSVEFGRIGDEDSVLRRLVRRPHLKQFEQMAGIGHLALDARMRRIQG